MNQGNERTTSMSKTKGLVQMAIFAALIVVLAFTPFIGYIPLGFTRATIIHIPVIMGSLDRRRAQRLEACLVLQVLSIIR